MTEYVVDITNAEVRSGFSDISALWGLPVHERIVLCRDCKHRHRVRSWAGTDVDECWLHASPETGALGKVLTDPDGFCKWGERKEVGA